MILNLAAYRFTPVDDPSSLVASIRAAAESQSLLGTVLVAEEGINVFLAGEEHAVHAFVAWLRADRRFAAIGVKLSRSRMQPFARLKVKRKREIIAFRRAETSPLHRRAPAVSPIDLRRWLDQGHDDGGRRVALLDTRNREETGYGSFVDAIVLPIDNFVDLPQAIDAHRDALRGATVVSFCTGGIRCEKAALWLDAQGIENVQQLDGGILGYFEQVGGAHYQGRCFVFDQRVALDPQLRPMVEAVADEPGAA
jgi:UPF0176 protein